MSSVAQPRIALGCGRHGMRRNCGSIPPLAKAGSCCQRLRLWSHPGIAHAGLADAVGAALGLSYSKFSLARIPGAACRSQVTAGIIRPEPLQSTIVARTHYAGAMLSLDALPVLELVVTAPASVHGRLMSRAQ